MKRGTNQRVVPRFYFGFTLPELVAVLVIVAVLAGVGLPRLWRTGFDEAVFAQETVGALRYAQKSALAMQRTVCAAFGSTSVTFTYASAYGSAVCDTNLPPPGGGSGAYVVNAQHGGTFSSSASFSPTPTNFSFDLMGAPSVNQTITLNDGTSIVVEATSGYVHSP